MAGEWKTLPVAEAPLEIIDGDRGVNYPKQEDFGSSGDCLFLNTGNVTAAGFNFAHCCFITKQKDAALRKGKLKRHDVVLTTRGTVGNVALFDDSVYFEHVRINSGMVLLRADQSKLLPRYLFQLVRSPLFKGQVAALTTGSAQPQLPIRDIRRVEIPLPPLAEQRSIAGVLGALDDKIELNRRMNATLEAMARALFQSWFVDFDPVRAKQEGRKPTGMDDVTAALFPDSFRESELGEIPAGWTIRSLNSLSCYISRGIGPSYLECGGGVCVLNQRCVRDHRVDVSNSRRHDAVKKPIKDRALELHDILVNSTGMGTLVRVAQVLHLPETAIVDSHITVVRAGPDTDRFFLGIDLIGRESEIEELGEGSTGQTELSRKRLGELKIVAPPFDLQKVFGAAAEPLLMRISKNDNQSRTHATLRDTLLPKLLSGELSVTETTGGLSAR